MTGTGAGMSGFMASAGRLESLPLIVIGAVLFLVSTLLPWAGATLNGVSDSSNAWDGDGPWLILGVSIDDVVAAARSGGVASGSTDLIILLPLALAAVGLAVARAQGKRIQYATEATVAAAGLLTILLIAEVVHIGGVVDDLRALGADVDGGAEWGIYVAVVAAAGMTFGAVRGFLEQRAHPRAG